MDRHKFTAADIWNVDKTGITTVQKPRSIVAAKGTKQWAQSHLQSGNPRNNDGCSLRVWNYNTTNVDLPTEAI